MLSHKKGYTILALCEIYKLQGLWHCTNVTLEHSYIHHNQSFIKHKVFLESVDFIVSHIYIKKNKNVEIKINEENNI